MQAPSTSTPSPPAAIREALAYLSSCCDRARSVDGQGFNKIDAPDGHRLARTLAAQWTPEDLDRARHLCRKYKRQLSRAGYELTLPPSSRRERLESLNVLITEILWVRLFSDFVVVKAQTSDGQIIKASGKFKSCCRIGARPRIRGHWVLDHPKHGTFFSVKAS